MVSLQRWKKAATLLPVGGGRAEMAGVLGAVPVDDAERA